MINKSRREKRILAIDPANKGFGFAVMEGPETLIDWGIKGVKGKKSVSFLESISGLIDQYEPDLVVFEDWSGAGSRRCKRIQEVLNGIHELCNKKKVKARSFSRSQVRRAFSGSDASTKHQIAQAIAQRLPELAPRLPPFRKCWMSEDYRMNIFDAVSLGITLSENKRTA